MKITVNSATHIGLVKNNNEVRFFAGAESGLFILRGGVGGNSN